MPPSVKKPSHELCEGFFVNFLLCYPFIFNKKFHWITIFVVIKPIRQLKMKYTFLLLIITRLCTPSWAQIPSVTIWIQTPYAAKNGHSHNDYEQKRPFKTAFEAGMGSIEADVYFVKNDLFVAHAASQIQPNRTLDSLYLQPLVEAIRNQKMYALSILIDIKSDAETTLQEVVAQIGRYPTAFNDSSLVTFVISGHRPPPEKWENYPKYILFDGRPNEVYTDAQWQHVGMVSDGFNNYTSLAHTTIDDPSVFSKMKNMVKKAHEKGKKVRFWATTDNKKVWATLKVLGVDFINTDMPNELAFFFGTLILSR